MNPSRYLWVLWLSSALGVSPTLFAQSSPTPDSESLPTSFMVELGRGGPLLDGMPISVRIRALNGSGGIQHSFQGRVAIQGLVRDEDETAIAFGGPFVDGEFLLDGVRVPRGKVAVQLIGNDGAKVSGQASQSILPPVLTLLPPLIAIVLAIATRQVLLSLFCGVWVGATLIYGFNPLASFLRAVDSYVLPALADTDHATVIMFSLSLGGMVGVMTATGGIRSLVQAISHRTKSSRSGQVYTAVLGTLIFFDDYANSLIVGNSMRPLTDSLKISREKLSFLVDATAAPVATIGIISTWTAYQIGLVADNLPAAGLGDQRAYLFFVMSIPFSFYSILMLLLVYLSAGTGRDFGAMLHAEKRAVTTGLVSREGAQTLVEVEHDSPPNSDPNSSETRTAHWSTAVVPVVCVVLFTLLGLIATGYTNLRSEGVSDIRLRDVMGAAESFRSLLWAAVGASLIVACLSRLQGWSTSDIIQAWTRGVKSLVLAVLILLLAWSIGAVCADLGTGHYILATTKGALDPSYLPVLAFVVAGFIAFSTGTSYGTMAILIPVLLPLGGQLSNQAQLDSASTLAFCQATTAAILGGAVFGDHCSPISDTTVLSSMATGADHIDHVRTQLPYAMLVAAVCIPCYLAVGWGWSIYLILPVGITILSAAFLLLSSVVRRDQ